jgi:predicted alpha/beta superfamily hydrolase
MWLASSFLGLLVISSQSFAFSFEIIVNIPATTPQNSKIYLTGNVPELCNWNPACVQLQPTGVLGSYKADLNFPEVLFHKQVEFKVTRGTWETTAAFLDGSEMPNAILDFASSKSKLQVYVIPHWKDLGARIPPSGLLIYEHFFSPQLNNERSLRIWLPPSYGKDVNKKYPVIYAHDGQNLFDPKTSATSGADWQLDLSIQRITHDPSVQEAIVVGIDSISATERFNEYDYEIKGKKYANFLIETVKPWVDKNFRTFPDRLHTFTLGSSMGALISVALVWNRSDVFSGAAALSLPVFIHHESLYKSTEGARPNLPIKIYMDHGERANDADYKAYCEDYFAYLTKAGFVEGQDLIYDSYAYSDHTEVDWARRVDIPLGWLLRLAPEVRSRRSFLHF